MSASSPKTAGNLVLRKQHLLNEIARPSGARSQPHRTRILLPMSVLVALVASLVIIGGPGDLGTPAFAVTSAPNGMVSIRVVSTVASADQMNRQLASQGIPVSIQTAPSTPDLVGTWVAAQLSQDVPTAIADSVDSQTQGYATTIELPRDIRGIVTLTVGRSPRPGETIVAAGLRNILAPGGALACQGLATTTPTQTASALSRLGYEVDFWTMGSPLALSDRVAQPPTTARVTAVFLNDFDPSDLTISVRGRSNHVIVQLASPGSAAYTSQLRLGYAPSQPTNAC